ncbi:MAG TPA: cobalamin-dependent protein [Acidimicrobiia bacterium]|nr:cobalamin-dependent protein [Acidimicrobiia bacterium]
MGRHREVMVRAHFPAERAGDVHGIDESPSGRSVETITLDDVHQFLELVDAGDVDAATRFALDVHANRVPLESVVTKLLARAQELVGARWQQNLWTEERERACTALVESTLSALVARARGGLHPRPDLGEVVVCCADGDEHTLGARMLSELLRARRRRVTFLGSATPLDRVAQRLEEISPVAVAVSASVPFTLPGVHRVVRVAHELQTPVLVGGRGFGGRAERAAAVGADGYSDDVGTAARIVDEWEREPPPGRRLPAVPEEAQRLDASAAAIARAALRTIPPLGERVDPMLQDVPSVRRGTEHLVRCVASAVLVRDDAVLTEYLDWLHTTIRARGVETEQLVRLLEAIASASPTEFTESRRLLGSSAERLRTNG